MIFYLSSVFVLEMCSHKGNKQVPFEEFRKGRQNYFFKVRWNLENFINFRNSLRHWCGLPTPAEHQGNVLMPEAKYVSVICELLRI